MTIRHAFKELAAKCGVHVVRMTHNPEYTMLGLKNVSFETIFDIGANEGQFARSIRRRFPSAHLICFEPTPNAFKKLESWTILDGNAVAFQLALGDMSGSLKMHLHAEHTPSSSLLSTTELSHDVFPMTVAQEQIDVRVERMDDYIAKVIQRPLGSTLVKLDVQGFEARVLKGATSLLSQCRACLVEVCLDNLYQDQSSFFDVCDLARTAGLRYAGNLTQSYADDGHIIYLDALFIR